MSTTSSSRLAGSRVYIVGYRGLAGSAILKRLEAKRCGVILTRTQADWILPIRRRSFISLPIRARVRLSRWGESRRNPCQ